MGKIEVQRQFLATFCGISLIQLSLVQLGYYLMIRFGFFCSKCARIVIWTDDDLGAGKFSRPTNERITFAKRSADIGRSIDGRLHFRDWWIDGQYVVFVDRRTIRSQNASAATGHTTNCSY